jgi:tryptophan synthase alpha chain
MSRVQTVLERSRVAGRPSLVSYVTAGIRADWTDLLAAMIEAGADAIEIGLPFSDPMLDGPVIQQASGTAIGRGANTTAILAELRQARPRAGQDGEVPLIAMSYTNHAYQRGITRYCEELAGAGFSGTIIPDLPVGEADEYLAAAAEASLDATLMVTPATPPAQMRAIARRSRGFLYVMSVMATTGSTNERDDERRWALAARALGVAAERSAAEQCAAQQSAAEPCATGPGSPPPVLIGFGIDTPARAAAAARHADGVIVASALMRQVLDGADADDMARAVGDLRAAIDTARSAA